MSHMRCFVLIACSTFSMSVQASIFGEENIALLKLVGGQLVELERLADTVGILENQRQVLLQVNAGIQRTVSQIATIQEIVNRAQGLDPASIRNISALNRQIDELKSVAAQTQEVMRLKLAMADLSISQAAIQSDTTYRMGQEMVGAGSALAEESRNASPGRAAQITASAESSQMLAQGVQLQGLAHLIQIQAETLDLQKTLLAEQVASQQAQMDYFRADIGKVSPEKLRSRRLAAQGKAASIGGSK